MVCMGTTAKASLISQRSMSFALMPASVSALCEAGAGALSMITGSAPQVAVARILPRGFRPCALTNSSLASATAAAPSTMPLELPAVCTCWIVLTCG
jgi:hypothetical protein